MRLWFFVWVCMSECVTQKVQKNSLTTKKNKTGIFLFRFPVFYLRLNSTREYQNPVKSKSNWCKLKCNNIEAAAAAMEFQFNLWELFIISTFSFSQQHEENISICWWWNHADENGFKWKAKKHYSTTYTIIFEWMGHRREFYFIISFLVFYY